MPELVHQRALLSIWVPTDARLHRRPSTRPRGGAGAPVPPSVTMKFTPGIPLARPDVQSLTAARELVWWPKIAVAVDVVANAVEIRGPERKETRAGIAGRAVEVDDGVAGFRNPVAPRQVAESPVHWVDARSDDGNGGQDAIERPNVHVQLDTGRSVQIRDGRIGERQYNP